MIIKRRDFVKGCVAISALSLSVGSATARHAVVSQVDAGLNIEKSIKASFGGGFSLLSYKQEKGLTHANIAHSGNRFEVASNDLLNWQIMRSSLSGSHISA